MTGRPATKFSVFVKRAKVKHGDKYGYHEQDYTNLVTKTRITCKACSEDFWQRPHDHFKGGCQTCALKITGHIAFEKAKNSFIERAKEKHGNRFEYSRVEYTGRKNYIEIRCAEHDVWFNCIAGNHLNGDGSCPICSVEKSTAHAVERKVDCAHRFKEKAISKHGDLYDYSQSVYVDSITKVVIVCKDHGPFKQSPCDHLKGAGCPSCKGGFDPLSEATLYYVRFDAELGPFYKIGITNISVDVRFKRHKTPYQIIKTWPYLTGENAAKEERRILNEFSDFRYKGENVIKDGNTELFITDVLNLDIQ
jgi:hypothetical protein